MLEGISEAGPALGAQELPQVKPLKSGLSQPKPPPFAQSLHTTRPTDFNVFLQG